MERKRSLDGNSSQKTSKGSPAETMYKPKMKYPCEALVEQRDLY